MKTRFFLISGLLLLVTAVTPAGSAEPKKIAGKLKVLVVSSYHREYLSSQDAQRGFADALRDFGYFDNAAQSEEFLARDSAESPRIIIKRFWMDAKRKNEKEKLQSMALSIYGWAKEFKPGPDISCGRRGGRIFRQNLSKYSDTDGFLGIQ